jgi:hypothetical protein
MRFRSGDLVRNKITQEQGRVVRVGKRNNTVSYVVVVPATELVGEKEALWRQYEIDDDRDKRKSACHEYAAEKITDYPFLAFVILRQISNSPRNVSTALPFRITRFPSSLHKSSPPRSESWQACSVVLPSRCAQYGASEE